MQGFLLRYLRGNRFMPWDWHEDGKVLTWRDGETVAFRPEIAMILTRLASDRERLPSFPGLFLLLTSCREHGSDLGSGRWERLHACAHDLVEGCSKKRQHEIDDLLGATRTALDVLAELPDEAWRDPNIRVILALLVFSRSLRPDQYQHEAAEARTAIDELHRKESWHPLSGPESLPPARAHELTRFEEGLEELRLGLLQLRPERVVPFLQTGLQDLPEAPKLEEFEPLPTQFSRELMQQLRSEPEHQQLAALAEQCLAALHLPQSDLPRRDEALSGAANLSNRGPLSRLLLSELANDDETLALRVALGEALYLDREPQPDPKDTSRWILIDAGIRSWGQGRVVATAVALALAAQVEEQSDVRTWRSDVEGTVPIDLRNRSGLLEHLSRLSPARHPGRALQEFVSPTERTDTQDLATVRILVTQPEVLTDEEFLPTLREFAGEGLFVVSAAATGEIELHRYSSHGHQRMRRFTLDLDATLGAEAAAAAAAAKRKAGEYFLAARDAALPFRLPIGLSKGPQCIVDAAVLEVRKELGLLLWQADRTTMGARQLLTSLQWGHVRWFAADDRIVHVVIEFGARKALSWLTYDLDIDQHQTMVVDIGGPAHTVHCTDRNLLVTNHNTAQLWRMGAADPVHVLPIAGPVNRRDGVTMETGNDWQMLSVRGDELELIGVMIPGAAVPAGVTLLRRRPLTVMYWWGGTRYAHDLDANTKVAIERSMPPHLRLSHDGKRLGHPQHDWVQGFDPPSEASTNNVFERLRHRVHHVGRFVHSPIAIGPDPDRKSLLLKNRRGALHRIASGTQLTTFASDAPEDQLLAFDTEDAGLVATWDDGSQAIADPRGFIVLRSSHADLPEICLVPAFGMYPSPSISVVTSDGRRRGPLALDSDTLTVQESLDLIQQFLQHLP